MRRYEATRRQHPLAAETTGSSSDRARALALEGTSDDADIVIDTSDLNVHELKERLVAAFDDAGDRRRCRSLSFGYKHGLPLDVDIVIDCRFLPNPHWMEELRPLTGLDRRCATTCWSGPTRRVPRAPRRPAARSCRPTGRGAQLPDRGLGCTGGRHRSVVIAEELAARLRARGSTRRAHHDITADVSPADGSRPQVRGRAG